MKSLQKSLSDWKTKHPGALPEWAKNFARAYFLHTAKWRAFPDFIVLGTPKSGTTSFYSYLSQHQKVVPSLEKEPSYLRDPKFVSIQNYRACFPRESTLKAVGSLTGEGTTTYYYDSTVAKRILELPKSTKLFLIVRNPSDRAISQFYHFQRSRREVRDIDEVFDYLFSRYDSWAVGDDLPDWDENCAASDYLKYGIYGHFFPIWKRYHDNGFLKIYEFEELVGNPEEVMKDAFEFIGLMPEVLDWSVFNKGTTKEKHSELKLRLDDFYRPFNKLFYEQTGCGSRWL